MALSRIDKQYINIIYKLFEERDKQGITQEELAGMSGISLNHLNRIENRKTHPRINTFLKVLDGLGLTLEVRPYSELRKK